jgi:hypothetical protein
VAFLVRPNSRVPKKPRIAVGAGARIDANQRMPQTRPEHFRFWHVWDMPTNSENVWLLG